MPNRQFAVGDWQGKPNPGEGPAIKRVVIPELLDTDSGTAAEIAASLSDLRRINAWFGGFQTTQSMVELVVRRTQRNSLSLLEVASGAGHVPRVASIALQTLGIQLDVTLLDRATSHLNGNGRNVPAVAGDVFALPFRDASFDLVSSCLFVHHLEPAEFIHFVNESLRVCRTAVLINDVVRDPVHVALVYAGLPLFRSRMTRHDAPASVLRAYTINEMRTMLAQTKAARVEIRQHYLFRMAAVAWK